MIDPEFPSFSTKTPEAATPRHNGAVPPPLPPTFPPPPDQQGNPAPPVAPWRYAAAAMLLGAYVLRPAISTPETQSSGPILSQDLSVVLVQLGAEGMVFAVLLIIAWLIARPTRDAIYCRKPITWRTPFWGALWSVGLRMGVAFLVLPIVLVAQWFARGSSDTDEITSALRPKIENLLSMEALADPLYLLFMMTVVSFIFAGLREELWRAGFMASILPLLQRRFSHRTSEFVALGGSSIIFGIAHLPQGWGAVFLTTLLGLGLGAILVWRRSLAEATLAHGFFDATSFMFLGILSRPKLLERLGVPKEVLDQLLQR